MQNNKKLVLITLGVILCILGIYIGSHNYLKGKVDKAYDKINLQLLALNEQKEEIKQEVVKVDTNTNDTINANSNTNASTKKDIYEKYYIARLRIPKVNLEKGLVDINSKYNHVDKNIQIINGSDYPNVLNGNLILASHSGNNAISYFKNLYKLVKGDKCYISYNGKTYVYEIVNIYYEKKDGAIAINRDYDKTTLTLITCTKNSNNKQTVYIAELINVE